MSIQNTITLIRAFAAERKLSKRALAEMAGIGDTALRSFDKPEWNPTRKTLEKLEGVVPGEFKKMRRKQVAQ